MQRNLILIIILSTILLCSIGFNVYQYQNITQLTNQVNSLADEKNQLTSQVSELDNKIDSLDSKVNDYLKAQGRPCEKETETCLDELIEQLTTVTGPDCSSLSDGVCPKWCAVGADYDCCVEKGYEWIQGRGCHS